MQQWALAISEDVAQRGIGARTPTSLDLAEVRDGNDDRRSSSRRPLVTELDRLSPPAAEGESWLCLGADVHPAGYVRRRGAGLFIARSEAATGGVLGLIEGRQPPRGHHDLEDTLGGWVSTNVRDHALSQYASW
jgi:hypothetical protein